MGRILRLLLLGGVAVMPVIAHASPLQDARRLVDARKYDQAFPLYQRLLRAHPDDADLLIELARVYAWADRHGEAIKYYQQAIQLAPRRREDVVLPLAWQLEWSGRHGEALPLFEEAHRHALVAADPLYGIGEADMYLSRLNQALAVYRKLLARNPKDVRARYGEARTLLWMDRHHDAAGSYRAILAGSPQDREALVGLATAQYWAGFGDEALQTLGDSNIRESNALREQIERARRNEANIGADASSDSNHLTIHSQSLAGTFRRGPADTITASYRRAALSQNGAALSGEQAMVGYGTRFGTLDTPWGAVWTDAAIGTRSYDGGWQSTAWRVHAKWIPADLWRVDIDGGNDIVENITSIRNRVTLDSISAGFDYHFHPRATATAGAAHVAFDDGNRRDQYLGRLEYVALLQPRLTLGVEARHFTDSNPGIHRGYYNPSSYTEGKGFATAAWREGPWSLSVKGAFGRLWESPGSQSKLYTWDVTAARDLGKGMTVQAYAGASNSLLVSGAGGGGYRRIYGGISLAVRF